MTTAIDEKLATYKELQSDIQQLYLLKQQSLAQFNENTLVKGELDMLNEETPVFKLVGPVLMKVSAEESKENVGKRLQFIEAEITKLDNQIAEKQGLQTTVGEEISKLQQEMQKDAAAAVKQIVDDA
eukprot:CAMPEP_0185018550 /NCGR_PEP_ID=MMETSP1103-20130426/1236_1 /TAXON_ID=36769 /ORGANISM="Paraphysomonas bandaiensis, Strain Caron Lab Isolate" /LENGTH=126 /DNA_ID=CAMNT_0027548393 /DNA_START=18 /DNA_END=398 /DNA_ORIENTATION=+